MVVSFDEITDRSRLWVYQLNRNLTPLEEDYLAKQSSNFLESWAAHGTGLVASFAIKENRFLFFAADESRANASGCSIDSLTHFLKDMQQQMNIDFFDRSQVVYKSGTGNKSISFIDFKEKLVSGEFSSEILIYNTILQQKNQLKDGFLIPAKNSWLV